MLEFDSVTIGSVLASRSSYKDILVTNKIQAKLEFTPSSNAFVSVGLKMLLHSGAQVTECFISKIVAPDSEGSPVHITNPTQIECQLTLGDHLVLQHGQTFLLRDT